MNDEKFLKMMATIKAKEIWPTLNPSEQRGVSFGLFPASKMKEAEKQGHDGRLLSLALMSIAESQP